MATVTVDYFGMSGTGRTVTEAKRDAGEKIKRALDGSYTPRVLTHRGYAVLVARAPDGWDYRTILDPQGGIREGSVWLCGSNFATEADAVRSAQNHLAHMGWTRGDGTDAPEFIRARSDRDDFRRWAEFQMRYARARAAGWNDNDAHSYAGRNPARPELQRMMPDDAELVATV